ncbi:MAG TPA: ATP-dependent zinc metalloprotease FtsH [Planctomycetaceae bacterium]|nr:ATP-dependent zinc metalloprotease FtsH [Planctomycetaceae bacterium]
MSNPEQPPQTPPTPPGKTPGKGPRFDRNAPTNLILVFALLGLVLIGGVLFYNKTNNFEEIETSKFIKGLDKGTYSAENVYELTIGRGAITFQDAPTPKGSPWGQPQPKRFSVPVMALPDAQMSKLTELLEAKGIEFNSEKPPSEFFPLLYLYVLPILFLLLIFVFFRRISGAGTAMSFGRSRGRLHAQEDLDITFEDVAGIDEAVEELREIVEFLRNPGKYQALGGRIPRGVLLVGPPGTGKTLLAKAVAGEAGVPFISLSGSDFVEMFVGVGAARVRDMFGQAAAKSPSIIFIDELDALGKVRGSGMPGGHDERDQTLNALLVEMDGFSSDQSVIVMAATNRPETLDPALLRPGRFDRHVLVDRPDVKGREAILKVHIGKVRIADDVDLKHLARLTPGFVGADLASLVNEAALLAARKDKTRVTMHEFEEGIERVVAGLEKQTRIIAPDEKLRVAYHECGHALVACSLPHTDPVHKISIIPRGFGALGYTLQRPEDDRHLITQTELQNRICVLLGGITAEEIVYAETSTGAQNDLERCTDLARRMVMEFGMSPTLGRVNYRNSKSSPFLANSQAPADYVHSEETIREIDLETKRIIDEAAKTVHDVLLERRDVLEHMTRDLVEREVMDANQLKKILDEHATGPQIMPGTRATGVREPEPEVDSPTLRKPAEGP